MPKEDQQRMLLAGALALGVFILWMVFVNGPQEAQRRQALQAERARIEAEASTSPSPNPTATNPIPATGIPATPGATPTPGSTPTPGATSIPAGPAIPVAPVQGPRADPVRVAVDAPAVDGSISLRGARIDQLQLRGFYQTIGDKERGNAAGEVPLLAPQGDPGGRDFYAEMYWVTEDGRFTTRDLDWTQVNTGALTVQNPLKLSLTLANGRIDRTIGVDEHYMFTIVDTFTNTSAAEMRLRPDFFLRQRALREHTQASREEQGAHRGMLGMFADNQRNQTVSYADLIKKPAFSQGANLGWIALTTKYWMAAVIPHQGDPVQMQYGTEVTNNAQFGAGRTSTEQTYYAGFQGAPRTIPAGQSVTVTNSLFAGAKVVDVLEGYEKAAGPDGAKPYPWFTDAVDWSFLSFITKPFFWLLNYFHGLIGSFGLAILALTVCVKLAFFPIQWNLYKSMAKMRKIQPELEELRKRFAADKQRFAQEQLKLMQREKANPLAGCLPMIPQLFVFWALYHTLIVTIEMRHAPFYGWVRDMSAPDPTTIFNLFGLLPYDPAQVPVIGGLFAAGGFLHIGVWPLAYGATMYLLQGLSAPPTDPTQKMVMRFLPAVFLILFAGVAAGLAIYWTWSNLITMSQQYYIMRRNGVETELDKFLKKRFPPKPKTTE
jgi:YidC/Oxa1 family membrane protein insertase